MEKAWILLKIEHVVQDLTYYDEMEEEDRLPFLQNFKQSLETNETWQLIDKKCKEWDGDGLC